MLFMKYKIKDLSKIWIGRTKFYEIDSLGLPISYDIEGKVRYLNEKDLEILSYYKEYWKYKTINKYWKSNGVENSDRRESQSEQVTNSSEQINKIIQEKLSEEIKNMR